MAPPLRLRLSTYRGHRLELRGGDSGGTGWAVAIHRPPGRGLLPDVLRGGGGAPNGLDGLLAEARRRVDRGLDGGAETEDRRDP